MLQGLNGSEFRQCCAFGFGPGVICCPADSGYGNGVNNAPAGANLCVVGS